MKWLNWPEIQKELTNNYCIDSYSRAHAIEDGVLVDLTEAFQLTARRYYKVNVYCTAAVWSMIEAAVTEEYDIDSVVYDVIAMSRIPAREIDPTQHLFEVTLNWNLLAAPSVILKAVCGPGDGAEPVITIMKRFED